MSRRPGSAVHVPPDVFVGVTRDDVEAANDSLDLDAAALDELGDSGGPYSRVAAMLRRLAPYLPADGEAP